MRNRDHGKARPPLSILTAFVAVAARALGEKAAIAERLCASVKPPIAALPQPTQRLLRELARLARAYRLGERLAMVLRRRLTACGRGPGRPVRSDTIGRACRRILRAELRLSAAQRLAERDRETARAILMAGPWHHRGGTA